MSKLRSGNTNVVHCDSWEACLNEISKLAESQRADGRLIPELLFRGHADASWKLESTLDRIGQRGMNFSEYYRLIAVAQHEIEAFTGQRWEIPYYPDIESQFREWDFPKLSRDFHAMYGYMAHLRHHGFPSPLVDWTRSAHIGAYFAFSHASDDSDASIYVLSQARMTSSRSGKPQIITLGPNTRTHRRHYIQQCEYSLCLQFDDAWHLPTMKRLLRKAPTSGRRATRVIQPYTNSTYLAKNA
jgi:FRG domain